MIELPSPATYLITIGEATPENFAEQKSFILQTAARAAADGVTLIQIREKKLDARMLFELVRDSSAAIAGTSTRLLVNDRLDVALAAGADGVHLPGDAIPVAVVRAAAPRNFIIGVSAHSRSDVAAAVKGGADFVTFGPVFDTPGKGPAVGIRAFSQVCSEFAGFPILALGGIDEQNFEDVLAAGGRGIAAIRSLNDHAARRSILSAIKDFRFPDKVK